MDETTLKGIQQNVKKMGEQLAQFKTDLDNARRAGIDVADMQKNYQSRLAEYNKLKGVYGSA